MHYINKAKLKAKILSLYVLAGDTSDEDVKNELTAQRSTLLTILDCLEEADEEVIKKENTKLKITKEDMQGTFDIHIDLQKLSPIQICKTCEEEAIKAYPGIIEIYPGNTEALNPIQGAVAEDREKEREECRRGATDTSMEHKDTCVACHSVTCDKKHRVRHCRSNCGGKCGGPSRLVKSCCGCDCFACATYCPDKKCMAYGGKPHQLMTYCVPQ